MKNSFAILIVLGVVGALLFLTRKAQAAGVRFLGPPETIDPATGRAPINQIPPPQGGGVPLIEPCQPFPECLDAEPFRFPVREIYCGTGRFCWQDETGFIHYGVDCDPNSAANFGRTLPLVCREPNLRRLLEA